MRMSSDSTIWWRLRPKVGVVLLALGLSVILGVLDYVSGHDIVLSPLYLIPIGWVCWRAGRAAGFSLAVFAVVVWFVADGLGHYAYPSRVMPYWNGLMLLVFFVVVVWLLAAFHTAHLHLEEVVAQRTAALREEIAERKRLEIAKVQAERLAVVGTMASEVAHEIRNPLGSIALNLDLLEREMEQLAGAGFHPPEEGRVLLAEMRAEIRRIQHVLEDYLQFARLPKPQPKPIPLNTWLEQKLAFMGEAFAQAGVKLRTAFDPGVKTVSADAEQLWQATLNLIRNGLEAMAGGGELTVSTWHEGGEARLRVADTGRGMTPDQQARIFVPFFTTKPRGTGLGLTLVQQIIIEHGGRVECESTPGHGSTFTLFLPVARKT